MENQNNQEFHGPQEPYFGVKTFESARSSGYKTTENALAELIDNSIDAISDEIIITYVENNNEKVEKIIISDNGVGMNKKLVKDCLILGSNTEQQQKGIKGKGRIGKFGYGLPNASLSQCKKIQVYSWEKNKPTHYHPFDLDSLEDIYIPEIEENDLDEATLQLIGGKKNPSGTVVIWEKCDRLSYKKADTHMHHAEEFLGRIYRYKINNSLKIILQKYKHIKSQYVSEGPKVVVKPMDPLFLMSDTVISKLLYQEANKKNDLPETEYYKKFSKSESSSLPTSEKFEENCFKSKFTFKNKDYDYEIKTSIVNMDIQKPGIPKGGATPIGKKYQNKETIGNIYLVRDDREIECGKFTRGASQFYTYTEANRWWGIEIKFSSDLDFLFGVTNNKQATEFRKQDVQEGYDPEDENAELIEGRSAFFYELSQHIAHAISEVMKVIKKRGSKWDEENLGPGNGLPKGDPITDGPIVDVEGPRTIDISDEDIDYLVDRLKDKYPQFSKEEIKKSLLESVASKSRASIFYVPSDSQHLWSSSKIADWNVIELNTNHKFYEKIIAPQRMNEKNKSTLIAMELFISAAAIEEQNLIQKEESKSAVERFRLQLAIKLDEFLEKSPAAISEDE